MFTVEVIYQDQNRETVDFESKPSLDVKGNFVCLECGSGQKLVFNIDTVLYARVSYPPQNTVKPFKFTSEAHYHTKNETVELLMHSTAPKIEVKVGGNGGVLLLKEDDNVLRIINGDWLEGIKVDFFNDQLAGKKK